jgi:hypothetical protein
MAWKTRWECWNICGVSYIELVSLPPLLFTLPVGMFGPYFGTDFTILSWCDSEGITSLLLNNLAVKYAQLREVGSMRATARAQQYPNPPDFYKALKDYYKHCKSLSFIRGSLVELSSNPTRSSNQTLCGALNLTRSLRSSRLLCRSDWAGLSIHGNEVLRHHLSCNYGLIIFHTLAGSCKWFSTKCSMVFDKPKVDINLHSSHHFLSSFVYSHRLLYLFQNTYRTTIDILERVGKVANSLYAKVHRSFLSMLTYSL